MFRVLLAVVVGIGCGGGGGDKCTRAYEKVAPLIAKQSGTQDKQDRDKGIGDCKADLKKHPEREAMLDCVLAINGEPTSESMVACAKAGGGVKKRHDEAELQLGRIAKTAKQTFVETSAFTAGKVGPTPAGDPTKGCCTGGTNRCPSSAKEWASPVWKSLDFQIVDDVYYRYTYESDGKTFTATAVGDLDCDGNAATYTLTGTAAGEVTLIAAAAWAVLSSARRRSCHI